MLRRLLQPVWVLLAIIFLIEAWLWDHLEPIVARVVAAIPLARFKQWLTERVRSEAGWRVLNKVVLQTVCVRHEPRDFRPDLSPDLRNAALDRHTLGWCDRINRSGAAYLTPALLDGRWMVRVSIGALATEREHVERLWATMQEAVS